MTSLCRTSNVVSMPFKWRTCDGIYMTLDQMTTAHIFNAMKMTFNHLADAFNGDPVWFNHRYRDKGNEAKEETKGQARTVLIMMVEIDRRKDLPSKYESPYAYIRGQVLGMRSIEEARKEIDGNTSN